MKLAIAVRGPEGSEVLDDRFGRCERFLIIDTETDKRYSRKNEARDMGGAGIMAAQSLISEGVEALIAPDLGPNAFRVVSSAGIDVHTASGGNIDDLLKSFKEGRLKKSSTPTVKGHHGDW